MELVQEFCYLEIDIKRNRTMKPAATVLMNKGDQGP